ncbi:MAG: DUF4097 family beta strand repeat protein [Clostridia bacterium]|nr:DUF4097 family beta strand repeat protein [Clostridia bacterium]
MKPVSIIFLIVSMILIIVGLLTCSFAALQAKRQNVDLYDTRIENGISESEYDFTNDTVGKIQIDVKDCNVTVICGSDRNKVEMRNFSSAGYICEIDNRALVIEDTVNVFNITDIIENGKIRFKGFRYFLRDRKLTAGKKALTVYVSDKADIKVIDISVESGDVDIKGYVNDTDYNINIKTGRLTASDISTKSQVNAAVGKGTVNLQHVEANSINISTEDGGITAVVAGREITAEAQKGSVTIECESDLSKYNFNLKAPESTITLDGGSEYGPLVRAGLYIATDAQLSSFIHASSGTGSVTVKQYVAPVTPIETDTTSPDDTADTVSTDTEAAPLPIE